MHVGGLRHLRYHRRAGLLELPRRQDIQRETEVLRNRRDDVVFDTNFVADLFHASRIEVIHEDGHGGPCVIPLMLDLGSRVQRIGQHGDAARPERGKDGDDGLGQVRSLDGDSRSLGDAERGEGGSQAVYLILQPTVRQRGILKCDCRPVPEASRGAVEHLR